MASRRKLEKVKLNNAEENVFHPWQAWWHPEKQRKFYQNVETKVSVWEHPDTLKAKPDDKPERRIAKARRRMPEQNKEKKSKEDERMEVDNFQPKRRMRDDNEEEIGRKRMRTNTEEVLEPEPRRSRREPLREDSNGVSNIRPVVSWSSEVRPYQIIPYRACAIFDTCALLKDITVLDDAMQKQILSVIPYAVLTELDGLKNDTRVRVEANHISRTLKTLHDEKNYYLHLETSSEQKIKVPKYEADTKVKDDFILKCALRIKNEVVSLEKHLKLNEKAVLFVTDDSVLSVKAVAHDMCVHTVEQFLDVINDRVKQKEPERRSAPSDHRSVSKESQRRDYSKKERREEPEVSTRDVRRESDRRTSNPSRMIALKEHRKTNEWLNSVREKYVEREARQAPVPNEITVQKPRPSIPLADELFSDPEPPKRTIAQKPRSSQRVAVKPVAETLKPLKPRPRMPLSLTDDEDNADDNMDCS